MSNSNDDKSLRLTQTTTLPAIKPYIPKWLLLLLILSSFSPPSSSTFSYYAFPHIPSFVDTDKPSLLLPFSKLSTSFSTLLSSKILPTFQNRLRTRTLSQTTYGSRSIQTRSFRSVKGQHDLLPRLYNDSRENL